MRLLRELVATASVNPSLVPGAAGEAAIADLVAHHLRRLGVEVHVAEAAPGRPNVVGVLEGRAPGPTLMFCGHLDTVGVADMAAPFDPVERDGRLYGRGAQDMKGGLAAMIGAAGRLATEGWPAGRLLVAAVVDEEYASVGADALVAAWRADGAVVTEPTDLAVGVAHKGFVWIEVETRGRAAHGSRPREGRDAIVRMGRVLARLGALDRMLQKRPPHPLLGTASLHASLITGGRELSSYPDRCVLQMERRTLPAETPATALGEVEAILGDLAAEDDDFAGTARLIFARPAYELGADHVLAQQLQRALARRGRPPCVTGLSFWTDAAVLGAAGIPTVVFGPGGAGLHSVEEYVELDQVLACQDVLVEVARSFCGATG